MDMRWGYAMGICDGDMRWGYVAVGMRGDAMGMPWGCDGDVPWGRAEDAVGVGMGMRWGCDGDALGMRRWRFEQR